MTDDQYHTLKLPQTQTRQTPARQVRGREPRRAATEQLREQVRGSTMTSAIMSSISSRGCDDGLVASAGCRCIIIIIIT